MDLPLDEPDLRMRCDLERRFSSPRRRVGGGRVGGDGSVASRLRLPGLPGELSGERRRLRVVPELSDDDMRPLWEVAGRGGGAGARQVEWVVVWSGRRGESDSSRRSVPEKGRENCDDGDFVPRKEAHTSREQ